MASCWIPKPSPWPIAKPALWTAPLRCFPPFSAIEWRCCPAIFAVDLPMAKRACATSVENRSASKRKVSDLQRIRHQLARLRSDHMVDFRYDSGSFSHGRRDALGGARPHIADGEDTGPAGLKR